MEKISPEERYRRIEAMEQYQRDLDASTGKGDLGKKLMRLREQSDAEKRPNPLLVRVFKVPPPTGEFCFEGRPADFVEVDWFREEMGMMESEGGRSEIREFIEKKVYAKDGSALLVMSPVAAFTIDYTAAKNPSPVQR